MTKQALIELRDNLGSPQGTDDYCPSQWLLIKNAMHGLLATSEADLNAALLLKTASENNSLDAAVSFLEAVLPEFAIDRISKWPDENATVKLLGTHEDDGERWHRHSDGRFKAEAETPARALLLATLDALIEGAE